MAPGSLASIHSFSLGNLREQNLVKHKILKKIRIPFILFADVIFFSHVHQIDHGLGSNKEMLIKNFNLREEIALGSRI